MPVQDHFYGGQAVIEGVMMRGRGHWAVAVRRPDQSVHIESHEVRSVARRFPLLAKPGIRGILALGQALTIGTRALSISANQSVEDDKRLSPRQMAMSMAIAFVVFTALFVIAPYLGLRAFKGEVRSSLVRNLAEGGVRVLLFLGYLALIGRLKDIRRVFQYHGAEHKTISAYEHGDPLEPETVDRARTAADRDVADGPDLYGVRVAGHPGRDPVQGRRHPGDRGHLLRDAPARRQVHAVPVDAGAHGAGPVAPEDHHQAPGPEPDPGRHRRVRGSASPRGQSGRRSGPDRRHHRLNARSGLPLCP